MVVAFGVLCALTAVAIAGVIYVAWHDRPLREAPPPGTDGLMAAGVVMTFVFPLGGFIAGCILLAKQPVAGTVIMLASVALGVLYLFGGLVWLSA